jgi:hypothetical protein
MRGFFVFIFGEALGEKSIPAKIETIGNLMCNPLEVSSNNDSILDY